MTNAEIVELAHQHMINVYGCLPLAFVEGRGSYLYDADGNRYLDFFCGLAVTSLGHWPSGRGPRDQGAGREADPRLQRVPLRIDGAIGPAASDRFDSGKIFFCNSGAEANEAAIKLARRWGHEHGGGRFEIIATLGSFHGRTTGDAERHRAGESTIWGSSR